MKHNIKTFLEGLTVLHILECLAQYIEIVKLVNHENKFKRSKLMESKTDSKFLIHDIKELKNTVLSSNPLFGSIVKDHFLLFSYFGKYSPFKYQKIDDKKGYLILQYHHLETSPFRSFLDIRAHTFSLQKGYNFLVGLVFCLALDADEKFLEDDLKLLIAKHSNMESNALLDSLDTFDLDI